MADNINEIIKLKSEIEQLKKEIEFKNGWLSLISHDFKEAFNTIQWLVQSLEDKAISEKDFFMLLPRVKQDAKKNLQIIGDTSNWLKTQQKGFKLIKTEIFAIEVFMRLMLNFKNKFQNKNLQFSFHGDENIKFSTDIVLLNFILDKILDNAVKYSTKGNSISFNVSKQDDFITFSIIDSGIGIKSDNVEKLFSFENVIHKGTNGEIGAGLSLKIVKKFVYLMEGNIEINSAENEGTTISITIPQ